MADAPELEFLQRTLVDPGLLAPDHLDAWRLGWPGSGSFFAHLVELGAIARPDLGTLSAVFKGYLKLPPAGLINLFKIDAERAGPPVPADRLVEHAYVPSDRSERAEPHVPADRSEREARQAEGRREPPQEIGVEAAANSSPALRAAMAAAIDAALSGLPMEPSAGMPATRSTRVGLPQVGDFVAGYQLRTRLGQGTRGAVYRAWASAQGRSVIINLRPAAAQGAGGLVSAAAQAAMHGRVRHPGVLKVLAVGEDEALTYLVFEDLYAVGLAECLAGEQPLTPARVAQIGAEVARTLAAAAAVGVMHGDLKPAHLLVFSSELRVKLTDFLAPGEAPSSRAYLAPERLRGDLTPDVRADMYSLGATLHHAATGRAPLAHGARHAQPLALLGLPASLSRVVARLMHEQPGERYADWDEAAEALLNAEPAAGRALADPEDMSHRAGEDRV